MPLKVTRFAEFFHVVFHAAESTDDRARIRWIGMKQTGERERNRRLQAALVVFLTSLLVAVSGLDMHFDVEPLPQQCSNLEAVGTECQSQS